MIVEDVDNCFRLIIETTINWVVVEGSGDNVLADRIIIIEVGSKTEVGVGDGGVVEGCCIKEVETCRDYRSRAVDRCRFISTASPL